MLLSHHVVVEELGSDFLRLWKQRTCKNAILAKSIINRHLFHLSEVVKTPGWAVFYGVGRFLWLQELILSSIPSNKFLSGCPAPTLLFLLCFFISRAVLKERDPVGLLTQVTCIRKIKEERAVWLVAIPHANGFGSWPGMHSIFRRTCYDVAILVQIVILFDANTLSMMFC